jgi:diaminopimelate epimerase
MELSFAKLNGAGNDFVGLDNRDGMLGDTDKGALARVLCDRHFGVGADGIIILAPSTVGDVQMQYYNADGSAGGMCGNGGRCAAVFARAMGCSGDALRVEALGFVYRAEFTPHGVRLHMKNPVGIFRGIRVQISDVPHTVHAIDTGSPHIVQFVSDLPTVPVETTGRTLREHARFAPEGTNVNFVETLDTSLIAMRTYERGVEAETLACGTGSVASAVIAHLEYGLRPPIRVRTWSGEFLRVDFTSNGASITDVVLEGPAVIVFQGRLQYDPAKALLWDQSSHHKV